MHQIDSGELDYESILLDFLSNHGEYLELGQTTVFVWSDEQAFTAWHLAKPGDPVKEPEIMRMPSSDTNGFCTCGHDYTECALAVLAVSAPYELYRVLYHRSAIVVKDDEARQEQ